MITLYGTPLSLYTGKVRSYFINAGILYHEVTPTSEHYKNTVLPAAGGRTIPTIELENGDVIRDGTAIIDHFESLNEQNYSPVTPRQKIVSRLFDVIGAEGLLRPAMHYRWNFPEQNAEFVAFHFESMIPDGLDKKVMAAQTMSRMQDAGKAFGAVEENFSAIEKLYLEQIKRMDRHFSDHPYLLGRKPCIGDFGLIAPLYAHLGRDPAPLQLMQSKTIRLFRWVERMNRPDPDFGEFGTSETNDSLANDYLANDLIPATLIDLMSQFAVDFIPETTAAATCINQWLDDQDNLESATPIQRGVGFGTFSLRGHTVNALAQPYRFFLLKRMQDDYAALDPDEQASVLEMLTEAGMETALELKLDRNVVRSNNLEVWE